MTYFIKLDDGKNLRKKVLESSKSSLQILKGYQNLLDVRKRKSQLLEALRTDMKELTLLVNKLEELLPQFTKKELKELQPAISEEAPPPAKKGKTKGKKTKKKAVVLPELPETEKKVYLGHPEKKTPVPDVKPKEEPEEKILQPKEPAKRMNELEQLESKLSRIEGQLGRL